MLDWVNDCSLSEGVQWRVMPDEWRCYPIWWKQRLLIYLKARQASRQERQPMTPEQLAPYAMSKEEARSILGVTS